MHQEFTKLPEIKLVGISIRTNNQAEIDPATGKILGCIQRSQAYTKFTNGPGAMPQVVREPWFAIWGMSAQELGGVRSYLTDFEIYDERASENPRLP